MNPATVGALTVLMEQTYNLSKENRLEELRRLRREVVFIEERLQSEIESVHTLRVEMEM